MSDNHLMPEAIDGADKADLPRNLTLDIDNGRTLKTAQVIYLEDTNQVKVNLVFVGNSLEDIAHDFEDASKIHPEFTDIDLVQHHLSAIRGRIEANESLRASGQDDMIPDKQTDWYMGFNRKGADAVAVVDGLLEKGLVSPDEYKQMHKTATEMMQVANCFAPDPNVAPLPSVSVDLGMRTKI